MVKWNGIYSCQFDITRGTRQGSSLSPSLFNIFINDLLLQLESIKDGVHIGPHLYTSFDYADDIPYFLQLPLVFRILLTLALYILNNGGSLSD